MTGRNGLISSALAYDDDDNDDELYTSVAFPAQNATGYSSHRPMANSGID
jgi:hypothetical protein